jgi:hypothetical protein
MTWIPHKSLLSGFPYFDGSRLIAVPIAKLIINPKAQRQIYPNHVKRMLAAWDERLIGVVCINKRPNGWWSLMNGQQRTRAMIEHGVQTHVMAVELQVEEVEEPKLFVQLNFSKPVTLLEKFWRMWYVNNPVEVEINKILTAQKFALKGSPNVGQVSFLDTMNGVGVLYKIHATPRKDLLNDTLLFVRGAFPLDGGTQLAALGDQFMYGVALTLLVGYDLQIVINKVLASGMTAVKLLSLIGAGRCRRDLAQQIKWELIRIIKK